MITIDQAQQLVAEHVVSLPAQAIHLTGACGRHLVGPVVAAADSPPFDKSLVDGFAIDASDPSRRRRVVGRIVAGQTPTQSLTAGQAVRLMTGAPLPPGANSVVKFEDCESTDDEVCLPNGLLTAGDGVLSRGASYRAGQTLVPGGKRLAPLDLALIAETGQTTAQVTPSPRVAVLPTGNELAERAGGAGASQIYNSNGPMLQALVAEAGATPLDLGIARDDPADLQRRIEEGLQADVLLMTGGVSAGDLDLVPAALTGAGVECLFHRVAIKPGKPVWFGRREAGQGAEGPRRDVLVFGLPGHPVSALTAYRLLVAPALAALQGARFCPPTTMRGRLRTATQQRGKRTAYLPCRFASRGEEGLSSAEVELLDSQGSADLLAAAQAAAWVVLPPGKYEVPADSPVEILLWDAAAGLSTTSAAP